MTPAQRTAAFAGSAPTLLPLLARQDLPASPTSPGRARALVRNALATCPPELVDVAELLVTELVTNTLLHGNSSARLRIDSGDAVIRVVVGDDSSVPPRQGTAEADEVSGRGLFLVNALATSWGWQVTDAGKDVWFELRT